MAKVAAGQNAKMLKSKSQRLKKINRNLPKWISRWIYRWRALRHSTWCRLRRWLGRCRCRCSSMNQWLRLPKCKVISFPKQIISRLTTCTRVKCNLRICGSLGPTCTTSLHRFWTKRQLASTPASCTTCPTRSTTFSLMRWCRDPRGPSLSLETYLTRPFTINSNHLLVTMGNNSISSSIRRSSSSLKTSSTGNSNFRRPPPPASSPKAST